MQQVFGMHIHQLRHPRYQSSVVRERLQYVLIHFKLISDMDDTDFVLIREILIIFKDAGSQNVPIIHVVRETFVSLSQANVVAEKHLGLSSLTLTLFYN